MYTLNAIQKIEMDFWQSGNCSQVYLILTVVLYVHVCWSFMHMDVADKCGCVVWRTTWNRYKLFKTSLGSDEQLQSSQILCWITFSIVIQRWNFHDSFSSFFLPNRCVITFSNNLNPLKCKILFRYICSWNNFETIHFHWYNNDSALIEK